MIFFSKIAQLVHGSLVQLNHDIEIKELLLDSRKININEFSLFFAIQGERHDAHRYINDLYEKGIRNFIIEQEIPYEILPAANIILVKSSIAALQQLSVVHRNQFDYPVIGITGSNGKTIVKEWLSQLLSRSFKIVKNPRSYNSQVGVPLSVWQMNKNHELGIFEAGISKPAEMVNLQKIIKPTLGIFTNIGTAHEEGFQNEGQKIREKLLLFSSAEILIFSSDYQNINKEVTELYPSLPLFTWSLKNNPANIQARIKSQYQQQTYLEIDFQGELYNLIIPFNDPASIENTMHCIACMLYFKKSFKEIAQGIMSLQPIEMRLELKQGINNCYLIDDSYNNDFEGLSSALNFLEQQKQDLKKGIIISDFLETSASQKHIYQKLADLIVLKNINRFIGIGPQMANFKPLFPHGEFFNTVEDFLQNIKRLNFFQEIILIKGARKFQFEKIVKQLQYKAHGTILEINLDAIVHNLNFYKSLLLPKTKIMVMVKAFAYGSGSYEVANLLQFHRIDYLGVAYTDEGVDLRTHGITLPIMVMNPSADAFSKIIEYNLEPEIYSFKILKELKEFISYRDIKSCKIHLKIDTGMHRLGFESQDISKLIQILQNSPEIKVASIFSHLAAADSFAHDEYTKLQLSLFQTISNTIESQLKYDCIKHILNSPGISNYPDYQFDMVRLGIGIYGVDTSEIHQSKLATVGTLKSIISQVKHLPQGATVGYSRNGVLEKPSSIATIAIGYADGYDRRFSKGVGKVLIDEKLCPVIGNVCMDMIMVDISDTQAKEGDEVEIFGEGISILKLAQDIKTIPYEILTNVSGRVKRVFYSQE